jgi:hypothetical protein
LDSLPSRSRQFAKALMTTRLRQVFKKRLLAHGTLKTSIVVADRIAENTD